MWAAIFPIIGRSLAVPASSGSAACCDAFSPDWPRRTQPWFWTITARDMPPSTHNHGYADSREDAMAKFKTQWSVK